MVRVASTTPVPLGRCKLLSRHTWPCTNSNEGDLRYTALYNKPTLLEALAEWEAIAKEEGVTKADLASRWVRYNSALRPEHGDAIIIGASSVAQLQETLDSINAGPLSQKAAARIDALWETIKDESPQDNFSARRAAQDSNRNVN